MSLPIFGPLISKIDSLSKDDSNNLSLVYWAICHAFVQPEYYEKRSLSSSEHSSLLS